MTYFFSKRRDANTVPKRRGCKFMFFCRNIQRNAYKYFATIIPPRSPKNIFQNHKWLTILEQLAFNYIVRKLVKYLYPYDIVLGFSIIREIIFRNSKKIPAYCSILHATREQSIGVKTDSFSTINIIN